jgi:exodeoxyribonuclease III
VRHWKGIIGFGVNELRVFWRIDYQIATPKMAARARRCEIYKTRRFSDHAPLLVEYSGRL